MFAYTNSQQYNIRNTTIQKKRQLQSSCIIWQNSTLFHHTICAGSHDAGQ